MKNKIIAAMLFLSAGAAMSNPPILVDAKTGKFLGNLSANQFDPNSVNNPYGRYGSKYSADSINNEFGQYGSKYSNDSANNPYATNAPAIISNEESGYNFFDINGVNH